MGFGCKRTISGDSTENTQTPPSLAGGLQAIDSLGSRGVPSTGVCRRLRPVYNDVRARGLFRSMTIATTVGDALEFEQVDFCILRHVPTDTAAATAREAGIAPECLAKAVLLKDFNGYLLTVIPASNSLDIEVLREQLHRRQLMVAEEDDLDELFCDCELGAVPPLGPWYRVPTIVESRLKQQADIYFEAGDHRSLVHVTETGFEQLLEGAEYLRCSHQAQP